LIPTPGPVPSLFLLQPPSCRRPPPDSPLPFARPAANETSRLGHHHRPPSTTRRPHPATKVVKPQSFTCQTVHPVNPPPKTLKSLRQRAQSMKTPGAHENREPFSGHLRRPPGPARAQTAHRLLLRRPPAIQALIPKRGRHLLQPPSAAGPFALSAPACQQTTAPATHQPSRQRRRPPSQQVFTPKKVKNKKT